MSKDLIAEARKMIEALYFGEYDNEKIEEGAYSNLCELCAELARVKAERDAAVEDLTGVQSCYTCANWDTYPDGPCNDCTGLKRLNYKWRGLNVEEGE